MLSVACRLVFTFALLLTLDLHAAFKDAVREATLENGLKVILLEDHRAPLGVLQVWYKVGSRNERPGQTGISHLLEHMMFKGTKKVAPEEFSRIIEKNGGTSNAFTTEDVTVYFEKLARDRMDVALELEADRMANLSMDFKQFEEERKVVIEERRLRTEDDPASALQEQLSAIAFLAQPYHWPTIGWMEDIAQITREELAEHYRLYYRPNNAFVIAAGDFDSDRMLEKVRRFFAPIPRGTDPPPVRSKEPPQQGERRFQFKRPAELALLQMGYHVPTIQNGDAYALSVLSTILAGGKSSRLYREIVHRRELALEVGMAYDPLTRDPSLLLVSAQPLPGKGIPTLEAAINQELEKMKKDVVSRAELDRAKKQIEAEFVFGQDSLFGRAMLLGRYEVSAEWPRADEYLMKIGAVTGGDVQRIAREYLSADRRTVGRLVPRPTGEGPADRSRGAR